MNSNFAENLKKIRKDHNLSQEQLADKLGVSRQSVSKWEIGSAYPEMDKVLQICNMFNLNVDELLNQDIKEVVEKKEAKTKVNKYLDDFLAYITKTISMFSSMTFGEKFKCLMEQAIIILLLLIACVIVGAIGEGLINNFFGLIPTKIYYFISGLLETIYIILCVIFSTIVLAHIFKLRYLDYYVVASSEEIKDEENNTIEDVKTTENNKKVLETPKEKIIIRDPKHSEYRFINGLLKCMLFMFKILAAFIFATISIGILFLIFALFLLIWNIHINKIFIGLSIASSGALLIAIILLILVFSFIFTKNISTKKIFILFLVGLLITGIGSGMTFLSSLDLSYEDYDTKNYQVQEEIYDYNDKINIYSSGQYIFEIDNSLTDKIKLQSYYIDSMAGATFAKSRNDIIININDEYENPLMFYKELMNGLKENRVIFNYNSFHDVVITTSEKNIKQLINNISLLSYTHLYHNDNRYYLDVIGNFDNTLCYVKDGFYNSCVYLSLPYGDSINDFSYSSDGLKYDSNKYICLNEQYYYECYEK